MNYPELQNKTFLLLLIVVTLAFGWVLWPFSGAVFWGAILALLFAPLYRKLLRGLGYRRTIAALLTLLLCLVIVILPLSIIAASLAREVAMVYQRIQSGQLDFPAYFQQVMDALPPWISEVLEGL